MVDLRGRAGPLVSRCVTPQQLLDAVPLPFWLVVDGLAVYRLARLLTRDSMPLIARPRDAIAARWGDRALGELVVCPWCVSIWLAAGVLAARLLAAEWWSMLALVLAWSAVAGFLSSIE